MPTKRTPVLTNLFVAVLVSLAWLETSCVAACFQKEVESFETAITQFQSNKLPIVDVAVSPEQTEPVFLNSFYGPCRLLNGALEPLTTKRHNSKLSKSFIRFFNHPSDPKALMTVAWLGADRKSGIGFYSFKDGASRFEFHISERFRQPTFHQSPAGDIFIASRTGVLYWRKPDGEVLRYQLPLTGDQEPDPSKMFRKIEFANWADGLVCAYSIANPKYHQRALLDVLVADPKKGWRVVKLGGGPTGPATMTGPSTLNMLLYNRMKTIDLEAGQVTETQFDIPREGDSKVTPVSLHRMSDGTLLSCWRNMYRSFKPYDVDTFQDGMYQQICQWIPSDNQTPWHAGQWRVVAGKDQTITKDVVELVDEEGGWWIATGEGGILYRNPKGEYRSLDYRDGLAVKTVKQLKSVGSQIWAVQDKGASRIERSEWVSTPVAQRGRWRLLLSQHRSPFAWNSPDAPLSPIVATGNRIVCVGTPQLTYPMPSHELFRRDQRDFICFEDKDQKPWLISTRPDHWHLVGWIEGQWQRFDVSKKEGLSRWETIAEWIAVRQLMRPQQKVGQRIAFGKQGRIAVRSGEFGELIRLFDGSEWIDGIKLGQLNDDPIRGISFSDTAVLMWSHRSVAHQLPLYLWSDGEKVSPDQWQLVEKEYMKRDWRARREWSNAMRKSSPLNEKTGVWHTNSANRFASFTPEQMSIRDDFGWTTVKVNRSPLATETWMGPFGRHESGNWVFSLNTNGITRLLVYEANILDVVVGKTDLGTLSGPKSTLHPTWKCDQELSNVKMRYQVDNGRWSKWQDGGTPIKPIAPYRSSKFSDKQHHSLKVQLRSDQAFLSQKPLLYSFNVTYDQTATVDKLIAQLSAMSYEERQNAEKELSEIGPAILDYLQDKYEMKLPEISNGKSQAETKAALKRVIEQIKD